MPSAEPVANRRHRVHLPWRIAFTVYTIALLIGLHWPRLHIGVGDVPGPDKLIHFAAFAGFTFLLWASGWFKRLSVLWIVAAVASVLSETTQSLPLLGRTFSWLDITAELLGVTTIVLWLWALANVGRDHNRLRLRMNTFILQELFTRGRTWLLAGLSGMLMAIVLGACVGYLLWWFNPIDPELAIIGGLVAAFAGGISGVHAVVDAMVRRSRDTIAQQMPCLTCATSCQNASVDEDGFGVCPGCGARFHLGQWIMRMELPRTVLSSLAVRVGWLAIVLAIGVAAMYIFLIVAHTHIAESARVLVMARGMPRDMRLLIDLVMVATILAIAVRRFRVHVAKLVDRQDMVCRVCRHDVHATPVEQGLGRCGECGTLFVRL